MLITKLSLAVLALSALVACETVKGAGRDVSSAGRTITSETRAVQQGM